MKTETRKTRRRALPVLAMLLLGAAAGSNAAAARDLPVRNPDPVETARAVRAIDGDTIAIDTGAEVRLTGIQAPKLPLGRPGFRAWPLAAEARTALDGLTRGVAVRLEYGGRRIDRWGRLLARVYAGDVWLQREMVRRGMARVYTFSDNRAGADALYAAEREARAAGRGIWALDWYRIREPAELDRDIGTFQVVTGTVAGAAVVRGRGYLNFGADWRTDFTISVAPRKMKLFRASGVKIESFEGRRIRVRGWLVKRNGPMIAVTHPEQIEVIDP